MTRDSRQQRLVYLEIDPLQHDTIKTNSFTNLKTIRFLIIQIALSQFLTQDLDDITNNATIGESVSNK